MNTTTRTPAQIEGAARAAATRAANRAAKLATAQPAPVVETSQDRLEAAYDNAEIANWNSGVATPEAPDTVEAIAVTTGYTGPMIALRERLAAGAYSKASNGQPCCGDAIAIKLGTLNPAQVIRACIIAMNLPNNPYTHLNIGQQSMNLRNKLRGCMKRGEFGFGVVAEAVEQIEEEDAVTA